MIILSRINAGYDNYIHFNYIKQNRSLDICTPYFTCIYRGIRTPFLQLCADDVDVPRI